MRTAATRHAGLPFVPQPRPDELLGSWLLRIAQLYGLSLTTLLVRLGTLQTGTAQLPHWFSIDASTVNMDALSAATHLPRSDLETMTPAACRPHWPEELGACERCLTEATHSGESLVWNRNWMSPWATVCNIHGTLLTPVATRRLIRVRCTETLGAAIQSAATAPKLLDEEPICASDALWLQALCMARTAVRLPWGRTRPSDLARVVNAVAHEVISQPTFDGSACAPTANSRTLAVKDFALESTADQRAVASLPTHLRQRQWVLARVAHVLRWALEARTFPASWSSASVKRMASTSGWPQGALAWVCPDAADLVLQQGELRRKHSISPSYFKAYSALLASIQ
ncbi:TniQ family protein [Pseudorhodoferax soli]|uniref:TniQ protein n=1 Tax=Pseudorhodoferax soli TaxID=545864 RepID=A0A368X770_9BURK|nr:TniQ protein [Pseudorhodoferax soli]